LDWNFSWAELKDIFRKAGEVTYTDAHFRSGEGRGEVCYATRRDMENALDIMDDFEINGKRVRVSQNKSASRGRSRSRSRSRSPYRGNGRGNRNRSRPHRTKYSVQVSNLSSRCDWAELKDFMRQAGEVTYVDAHTRSGRGYGEACFSSRKDLYNAVDTLDGSEINGKQIRLTVKDDGDRSRSRSRSGRASRSRSRSSQSR